MTPDNSKSPSVTRAAWKAYNAPENKEGINWELIQQYLPLVKGIVSRMGIYFNSHVDMEDIYSVGVSGLIAAVQRFDPSKKASFSSYAAMRVKGAILDELRRIDWMPRAVRANAKKLRRTIDALEHKLQRAATEEEIQEELGLTAFEYQQLLDQVRPLSFVTMDGAIGNDAGEGGTMHDLISDANEMNARERAENSEVVDLMRQRIETLPELPKRVLSMYYFEGMRLAEIAEIFSLSEARICQIHTQTVLSLRGYLNTVHNRIDHLEEEDDL